MILSKMTVQIYDVVRIVEQITFCKLSDASILLLNRNRGWWRQMQVLEYGHRLNTDSCSL